MKHYYNLLGVQEGADKKTIRQAYRKLALDYHPDKNPSPGAENQFICIKEAYDYLMASQSYGTDGNILDADIRDFKQAFQEWQRDETELKLRQEEKRRKAREFAKAQYEDFVRNNENFRNSWYFYPAMLLAYSILYINRFVAGILFVAPVIATVAAPHYWTFIMLAALVSWIFACRLLSLATLYRDEISPYFRRQVAGPVFRA